MKKSRICLKVCAVLGVLCLLPQRQAGTTANKSLPVDIQLSASAFPLTHFSAVSQPLPAAPSLTKYIQEKFTVPEVAEAFRHSGAAELEKTAEGIKLKTGYLGSSKPQAAMKPEEIKALEALAARDNFKEEGLPGNK